MFLGSAPASAPHLSRGQKLSTGSVAAIQIHALSERIRNHYLGSGKAQNRPSDRQYRQRSQPYPDGPGPPPPRKPWACKPYSWHNGYMRIASKKKISLIRFVDRFAMTRKVDDIRLNVLCRYGPLCAERLCSRTSQHHSRSETGSCPTNF